jgi:hypothetical protein
MARVGLAGRRLFHLLRAQQLIHREAGERPAVRFKPRKEIEGPVDEGVARYAGWRPKRNPEEVGVVDMQVCTTAEDEEELEAGATYTLRVWIHALEPRLDQLRFKDGSPAREEMRALPPGVVWDQLLGVAWGGGIAFSTPRMDVLGCISACYLHQRFCIFRRKP